MICLLFNNNSSLLALKSIKKTLSKTIICAKFNSVNIFLSCIYSAWNDSIVLKAGPIG